MTNSDQPTDPASGEGVSVPAAARVRGLLKAAVEYGCKLDGPSASTILSLLDENFALAADQCHAGYGDERGNHRCNEIDARDAEIATLRAALESLVAIADNVRDHAYMSMGYIEIRSLRAAINQPKTPAP